jgi:two-component system, cell cycle response regulator DivK
MRSSRLRLAGKTILVVDDNPVGLRLLSAILESEGAATLRAQSLAEAIDLLRRRLPDGVVTDMDLDVGTGAELATMVRALPGGAPLPVIVTSASAGAGAEEIARRAGADAYVTKPVNRETLVAGLSGLIGRRAS